MKHGYKRGEHLYDVPLSYRCIFTPDSCLLFRPFFLPGIEVLTPAFLTAVMGILLRLHPHHVRIATTFRTDPTGVTPNRDHIGLPYPYLTRFTCFQIQNSSHIQDYLPS